MNKDSRGTLIEPGAQVAYNLSGYVQRGIVRHCTRSTTHIECLSGYRVGKISKVHNPRSILVLLPEDNV